MDLGTTFLGLKLANPLVPSASPLSRDLGMAKRLEDAGAAALVMYSLFEEEVRHDEEAAARFIHEQYTGFNEADDFFPVPDSYASIMDEYLEQLQALKQSLSIPVIASLNGVHDEGWIHYARELEQAGADALELNVYYVAGNIDESAAEVESRYVEMLYTVRQQVKLPVCMKLSPQFSSVGHFVKSLQAAGANGVTLFNRFYQPDIDLESREVSNTLTLSSSYESLLRIHWLALLYGRVQLDMSATGGFHRAEDCLKAIMAGASTVQLCSVLLQQGAEVLSTILQDMREWLEENEYETLDELRGSVSQQHAIDPAAYERLNYVELLHSHKNPAGIWR